MFQHMLVALDGSESSLQAAEAAVELAALFQARLDILSVEETSRRFMERAEEKEAAEHSAAVNSLEQLQAPLLHHAKRRGVQASGSVINGHAGQVILDYVREEHCDLLVLGHQGRSGVWNTSLGGTADKLVNHAPCSTLVIRSEVGKDLFKRLLIAFDGSPCSWQAFHVSLQLRKQLDASIHLLYTLEDVSTLSASRTASTISSQPTHWDRAGSVQFLQTLTEAERQWDDRKDEVIVCQGSASAVVPTIAYVKKVDLLVLGATGQGNPASSTAGKTAQKVANEALCSVLIVVR